MKLPRLSLRDLFWLVLVAAFVCGWGTDRVQIAIREQTVAEQTKEAKRKMQTADSVRTMYEKEMGRFTAELEQRAFKLRKREQELGLRPPDPVTDYRFPPAHLSQRNCPKCGRDAAFYDCKRTEDNVTLYWYNCAACGERHSIPEP